MAQTDFDLFVIGGGSGGVRAARIAAQHGATVALAECDRFGGTCVIRGCVPKKLLVYASRFGDEFADARGFGWTSGEATFDWPTLIANKDREIHRLEQIYEGNLKARGVVTFTVRARLDGPGAVKLADGRRITARTILIATGGRPSRYGDIPGAAHIVTSNEIFEMKALPKRIVVCGGATSRSSSRRSSPGLVWRQPSFTVGTRCCADSTRICATGSWRRWRRAASGS